MSRYRSPCAIPDCLSYPTHRNRLDGTHATSPFCKHHTCHAFDPINSNFCRNRVLLDHAYCSEHKKCSYAGGCSKTPDLPTFLAPNGVKPIVRPTPHHKFVCPKHICELRTCNSPREPGFRWCKAHAPHCALSGCGQPIVKDSNFCCAHSCAASGCHDLVQQVKDHENKFCAKHTPYCAVSTCPHVSLDGAIHCSLHTCEMPGCDGSALDGNSSGYRLCDRHTCGNPECGGVVNWIGAFCQDHCFNISGCKYPAKQRGGYCATPGHGCSVPQCGNRSAAPDCTMCQYHIRAQEEADEAARAEEAVRRAQEQALIRKAQKEAAIRKANEEEARRAREQAAIFQAKEKAARKAREQAARKAEEEAILVRKFKEEAARKAREEAAHKAMEEAAARKANEEAIIRKFKEQAAREAREEAARKFKEEAARKAREEAAARKAREETARMVEEEAAARKAQDEANERALIQKIIDQMKLEEAGANSLKEATQHRVAREKAAQEAEIAAAIRRERAASERREMARMESEAAEARRWTEVDDDYPSSSSSTTGSYYRPSNLREHPYLSSPLYNGYKPLSGQGSVPRKSPEEIKLQQQIDLQRDRLFRTLEKEQSDLRTHYRHEDPQELQRIFREVDTRHQDEIDDFEHNAAMQLRALKNQQESCATGRPLW